MPVIRYSASDGIGVITIDRPAKRNAMTFSILREFLDTVDEVGRDDAVRAVILTGVPGSFCAGTDLSAVSNTLDEMQSGESPEADTSHLARWAIVSCPKPVIAAIDGPAVGMGAEFTCQCDVRIASPNARFAWNFVRRGLVPDSGAGSWLLPRQIGLTAALGLLFSGDFLSADDALALGYVSEIVESGDLLDAARDLATTFLNSSPLALRLTKELVYRGLGRALEDHLKNNDESMQRCIQSDDHREGVAAFVEKREPRFVGR